VDEHARQRPFLEGRVIVGLERGLLLIGNDHGESCNLVAQYRQERHLRGHGTDFALDELEHELDALLGLGVDLATRM